MKKIHVMVFSGLIATTLIGLTACQAIVETETVTVTSYSTTTTTITTTQEISNISESCAIAIASTQIPPDSLSQVEINVYFDSELGLNGSWMVYFQHLYKTRLELEAFGWQEGDTTSFGDLPDDLDEYYGALIYIDAETGNVLSKTAGIWLGPKPPEVSS
ncbi:MAG: hypothetical protein PHE15_05955 [Dehalococcoidales bacterium]|nr:hypothetical protein [Dehalococcoidales bacterium]